MWALLGHNSVSLHYGRVFSRQTPAGKQRRAHNYKIQSPLYTGMFFARVHNMLVSNIQTRYKTKWNNEPTLYKRCTVSMYTGMFFATVHNILISSKQTRYKTKWNNEPTLHKSCTVSMYKAKLWGYITRFSVAYKTLKSTQHSQFL